MAAMWSCAPGASRTSLVNNAGGAPPAETATVSPRFNEKVIALNLLAPLAQAVHPVMRQDSGGGLRGRRRS